MREETLDTNVDFFDDDAAESIEVGVGEEFGGGDAADCAPVRAVRGEDDHAAVVAHEVADGADGSVRKGLVAGGEGIFGGLTVAEDDDAARADAESEDGAELVGEVGEVKD